MKHGLARIVVLALALSGAVTAGCKKRTIDAIAVIPKGTTHEFWKSVHAGAEKAAQELGVKVIWKGPLREDDREDQIKVVESFINLRVRPWLRRLITRLMAIIPAIIVVVLYGERGTGTLLILSQVVLSLQLSFAVFPLVLFTCDRDKMGPFVVPPWMRVLAWTVAVIIAALNGWLLYQTFA